MRQSRQRVRGTAVLHAAPGRASGKLHTRCRGDPFGDGGGPHSPSWRSAAVEGGLNDVLAALRGHTGNHEAGRGAGHIETTAVPEAGPRRPAEGAAAPAQCGRSAYRRTPAKAGRAWRKARQCCSPTSRAWRQGCRHPPPPGTTSRQRSKRGSPPPPASDLVFFRLIGSARTGAGKWEKPTEPYAVASLARVAASLTSRR